MRRISHYLSYIIALCSVIFCLTFVSLSPWPIFPRIFSNEPVSSRAALPFGTPPVLKAQVAPMLDVPAPIVSSSELYPKLLSHLVKINNLVSGGAGSGVIIWSGVDGKNQGHTFILTNRHVLPVGMPGTVEIFTYLNFRDVESIQTFPVFSVIQSISADLALVEVLSSEAMSNQASFISSTDFESMPLYTELFIVGCGLGNPPFISSGRVIGFSEERLMLNGFSVWGCSGGGVFDTQGRLVSINSQIGMASVNGRDHPITNISISIPLNVICDWLLETNYKFIVNSELGSLNDILKSKKYY